MTEEIILKAREYARRVHTAARCKYGEDNEPYGVHLDMVESWVEKHQNVLRKPEDRINTRAGAQTHDTIEDAQQSYNDVKNATNKDVADITLSVTDVHAENRMLRFLLTVPKTIKDYLKRTGFDCIKLSPDFGIIDFPKKMINWFSVIFYYLFRMHVYDSMEIFAVSPKKESKP